MLHVDYTSSRGADSGNREKHILLTVFDITMKNFFRFLRQINTRKKHKMWQFSYYEKVNN